MILTATVGAYDLRAHVLRMARQDLGHTHLAPVLEHVINLLLLLLLLCAEETPQYQGLEASFSM